MLLYACDEGEIKGMDNKNGMSDGSLIKIETGVRVPRFFFGETFFDALR